MNDLMQREIEAQPEYIDACLQKLRQTVGYIKKPGKQVIMGGCGDSYYSALAVSSLFNHHNIPFVGATAQEIEQSIPLTSDDLVILTSISGGTKRTVQAAVKAQSNGAKTIAVTCDPESALTEVCDDVITLPYSPITRKTPHSLDYSINLLANIVLLEHLSETKIPDLDHIASSVGELLSLDLTPLKTFTDGITNESRFFFLGAGDQTGTAMYAIAKLHEAGGITAFHSETENFWHGFHFMAQPADRVVLFHNPYEPLEMEQKFVEDLKQLSSEILYLGTDKVAAPYQVILPTTAGIPYTFLTSVVSQLLCLHVANEIGIEVDKPETKTRVSEQHDVAQSSWFSRSIVH